MLNPNSRVEMLDMIEVQGKDCAEIGVYEGEFARHIIAKNPNKLYIVDPWVNQPIEIYPNDDYANKSNQDFEIMFQKVNNEFSKYKNAIIVRDFSMNFVQKVPYESLDFVYIDAIHTFENTFCNIILWSQKVKKGGWICGHDYTGNNIKAFLGVQYAVDTFCKITRRKLDLITNEQWSSWGIQL